MKIQQMRLSDQALGKLSQLAMAVEIHEHKHFSLRKDINQVIGLLKVAANSGNDIIRDKLSELSEVLGSDSPRFFKSLGLTLNLPQPASGSQQTYRGQVVAKAASPRPAEEVPADDPTTKKKKIIYRGKVIYR